MLYFAYGSNLDPDRACDRGLDIGTARRASLGGHRLAFNKRANDGGVYANIVSSPSGSTWGAVFAADEAQMRALDECEGATKHYRRTQVVVVLDDGSQSGAIAYVACDAYLCPEAEPTAKYLAYILNGARYHGLPEAYVGQIQALARVDEP